jgi:Family of unknown function (DUF6459)
MTANTWSPLRLHQRPTCEHIPGPPRGEHRSDNRRDHPYVQGTLALEFDLASGVPARPAVPELTVLPGGRSGRYGLDERGIPDARDWSARFCQAIVEVVGGDRPVTQLIRWTTGAVYAELDLRVRVLGRTTDAITRGQVPRPQVRSVHIWQPQPDVAEVAAHVRYGERSRAVAARLQVIRRRWLCTALQLG